MIKNGVDCTISRKILDPLGRYIILKAQIQDKTYVLINVYAPNKDKDLVKFFDNLLSILTIENLDTEDNIILGGDLNCALNLLLDKKDGIFTNRKLVISCIESFQSKLDLVDIWRIKHSDTKSFTWSQKSPRIFCRLDYWLISNNLSDFVGSTEIISAVRTNHDAISLEFGKLESEMSHSQKQAVITLIEKKGKDRSLLENWRPISLVNVDAEITSKAIASRIKNVLPHIIHHNQTGYVKDCFIGETI